ncbi:Na+/H+ antiporter NhaC family protein [Sporosarcina koreensis]|uniref:Na+/H+ antiporter NhaC family protein n=1 Tax=Sporosarcina koreensis TaxID=334735 RepID=UPI00058E6EB3|nr:Na+/H+ antiporter NhaC family protein [Sporosarcina koreensis]
MDHIQPVIKPSFTASLSLAVLIILTISVSIIGFGAVPHLPILAAILLLIGYGLFRKVPYRTLQEGMTEGAGAGMGAVFLFFFIGMLISSWMMSGTIPSLINAGFQLITPTYFYAIAFTVTAVIGISIGSSLTTVATVGVALLSMAGVLGLSPAIAAGAIVSGAFFGDKMSPLSDTTNLASSLVGVDLFAHIRNMMWTTVPAFVLSFIIFAILSPAADGAKMDTIHSFREALIETGLVHWVSFVPLVLLIALTLMKVPALMTLAGSTASAVAVGCGLHPYSASEVFGILFGGFVSETGVEAVDSLLTRGGISSMFFTITLVVLALTMGGLLFKLGIVQTLLARVEQSLRTAGSVIGASAATAVSINVLIGEQYLSILLTGQAFQGQFKKLGLASKNLSRVMEDAGTVVNPLVPWSVCGIFIADVLGVPVADYFGFALFCLFSPVLTILFSLTGKTLTYDRESA